MCCRSEKRASSEKQDLGPRRFTNTGHRKPAYVFCASRSVFDQGCWPRSGGWGDLRCVGGRGRRAEHKDCVSALEVLQGRR